MLLEAALTSLNCKGKQRECSMQWRGGAGDPLTHLHMENMGMCGGSAGTFVYGGRGNVKRSCIFTGCQPEEL